MNRGSASTEKGVKGGGGWGRCRCPVGDGALAPLSSHQLSTKEYHIELYRLPSNGSSPVRRNTISGTHHRRSKVVVPSR